MSEFSGIWFNESNHNNLCTLDSDISAAASQKKGGVMILSLKSYTLSYAQI